MQVILRRPCLYRHNTPLSCQAATGQLQLRPPRRIPIPTCHPSRILAVLANSRRGACADRLSSRTLLTGALAYRFLQHEGAAASSMQNWRVPCKVDTPGQTTISHFRLSSLTYLPAAFPLSSSAHVRVTLFQRHWTRTLTRASLILLSHLGIAFS